VGVKVTVVTTETAEPLWLSVDRADRGHLVLREPDGDFVYWLLSSEGDRLATTRWPHADGPPIAPPVVGPEYHSYVVSSHRIMCFDPVGAPAWTVETAEAIGGAAVSFDGVLLVTAGSSIMAYETVDGEVRSRVLASMEGIILTSAPVLTSKGHLLVGSRDHLHALRARRA
jgi:outer membrane protein assembly factor BamB